MRILSLTIAFLVMVMASRSTDSPHGENFRISCNVCHSPKGWELDREIYSFDHNTTALPLEGQHTSINCRLCHPTLVFADAETECSECHTDMHNRSVGNDCARCHTPSSWIVNNISDVHRNSRFPLLGAHYLADCMACHPSASQLRYEPLGVECVDCHMQDYQSAANPNHVEGNLSTECTDCHSMTAFTWGGEGFSHLFFPLTDGHDIADCSKCHTTGDFTNTPTECITCHQEDYTSTTNPNHVALDFSTECIQCHTTIPDWKPAQFDHLLFPLIQGHAITDCARCHDLNDYSSASAECVSCHLPDYNATTNPDHSAVSFGTDCMECHTTMPGWSPAVFEHSGFPLTQGHAINDCARCHDINDYSNISAECVSCHLSDYNSTTNPNHVTANFPTDCQACHSTLPGWTPATFDHSSFPLTLGHAINDCSRCHDVNDFSNVSAECVSCHLDDYNGTTNPNHVSAGLSTDCMDCHTTLPGWKPATFTVHDALFFPIYSGRHNNVWNSCTECHLDVNNYADFSCINCHEHNKTETDGHHSGVSGYEYSSIACLQCHPIGEAGD